MQGNAPKSPITGVPGWMTDAEETLLVRYAKLVPKDGTIVNIGCEYGRSLIALAQAASQARNVCGIELAPKPELAANIREAKLDERVSIERGDSKVIGAAWGSHHDIAHLVFVDGAHEYENVKGDIAAWADHVQIDGYIIFHDVAQKTNQQPHYLHFEVAKAIDEWQQEQSAAFRLVESVDSIAVYQRVGYVSLEETPPLQMGDPLTISETEAAVQKTSKSPRGRKARHV